MDLKKKFEEYKTTVIGMWNRAVGAIVWGSKGQASIVGTVVTVIVSVVAIALGGIIINELFTTFNSEFTGTDMVDAWNNTKTMTTSGFEILPIVIIITVAVALISVIYVLVPRR